MATLDIVILGILLVPAVVGIFYGFLNIVFSLLAWAMALGISVKLVPYFEPLLESYIETPVFRIILAFAGLFIIGLMIWSALGYFIVKLLGRTGLTAADRIFGLFFGMGLGILIVFVIVFLAGFTEFSVEQGWKQSRLIDPFQKVSIWASQYLPENIAEYHAYETEQDVESSG